MYKQSMAISKFLIPRKFIPPRGTREGDEWNPSPAFLIFNIISKRFYFQWKAFDLRNKMRYLLWVVALLKACDVTNNGRHLGFYQDLEIRFNKTARNGDIFVLDMNNNT